MEIVNALEHLRKNNIVHRDLKPKNILLDDTFHIKVADFGAAKEISPQDVEKELDMCNFQSDDDSFSLDSSDYSGSDGDSEEEDDTNFSKNLVISSQRTHIGTAFYISPEMIRYRIA